MSDYDEHLISMAGGGGDVLDQIQARADKATAGPWEVDRNHPFSSDIVGIYSSGAKKYVVMVDEDDPTTDAEANFIAHAREDIPALLAMVREQRAVIERVRELADSAPSFMGFPDSGTIAVFAIRAALTATEGE